MKKSREQELLEFREKGKISLSSSCRFVGVNRVWYYRQREKGREDQKLIGEVLGLVLKFRKNQPRMGTRKLYYLLGEKLKGLKVGRDTIKKLGKRIEPLP